MTREEEFPAIPGYVSIKEAAKLLGISNPRMYGYVRDKRITALKAGKTLMIPLEAIEQFKLNPPGRLRSKSPEWRVYNVRNKLLSMDIEVRVHPGKQERLVEKLQAVQQANLHTFPGTLARYVFRDSPSFTTVSIWLIWRDTEMPDEATRERDLAAFRAAFADVLEWETAQISLKEGLIYT
jgi:excisionase family DNA binding protein